MANETIKVINLRTELIKIDLEKAHTLLDLAEENVNPFDTTGASDIILAIIAGAKSYINDISRNCDKITEGLE